MVALADDLGNVNCNYRAVRARSSSSTAARSRPEAFDPRKKRGARSAAEAPFGRRRYCLCYSRARIHGASDRPSRAPRRPGQRRPTRCAQRRAAAALGARTRPDAGHAHPDRASVRRRHVRRVSGERGDPRGADPRRHGRFHARNASVHPCPPRRRGRRPRAERARDWPAHDGRGLRCSLPRAGCAGAAGGAHVARAEPGGDAADHGAGDLAGGHDAGADRRHHGREGRAHEPLRARPRRADTAAPGGGARVRARRHTEESRRRARRQRVRGRGAGGGGVRACVRWRRVCGGRWAQADIPASCASRSPSGRPI